MKLMKWLAPLAFGLSLSVSAVAAPVTLKVFSGGFNQRPDLMGKLFDQFEKQNPDIKVQIETGGATSELQRQYLSTVLNSKDTSIDVFMIDVVNPAQYAAAGWIEPLNKYLGPTDSLMKDYLPVYRSADVVDGKVVALPAFADAMFMYYRKDLLQKYGLPEPKTWAELAASAKKIMSGEKNAKLQGLSIQGAPIEGAVCTFLLPYWSQGRELTNNAGHLSFDKAAASKGMDMWLDLIHQGVLKKNIAEVTTPDTVSEFKAGTVAFAINWGFAWDRFQTDPDSSVKGKVGVMRVPAMVGGKEVTCVGGWQWAVSAFSRHKEAAAKLVQYLSSPASSKFLAEEGSLLPVYANTYTDPNVLKRVPWFGSAAAVVATAKSRPVTPRYSQVSDVLRTTTSAMLGGSQSVADGVNDIAGRLRRVLP